MYVAIDLETTDLPNDTTDEWRQQPGIVEIGAIAFRFDPHGGYELLSEYVSRINPEKDYWDPGAIAAHKIKPDDVRDEPILTEVLDKFAEFCRPNIYWVGYNNKFDKTVLKHQLKRYNWETRFPWPSYEIDVMQVGKDFMQMVGKQDIKTPRLMELYRYLFNHEFEGWHGALADIRATVECYVEISKRLKHAPS